MNANKTHAEVCNAIGYGAADHPKAVEAEPGVYAPYGLGKHGASTKGRVYFVDAETGEELRFSGAPNMSMGASGFWKGARYTDTVFNVGIIDELGRRLEVTADAFPGHRVIVKAWCPRGIEWRALVATSRGWERNGGAERKLLGAERMGRAVSRAAA